MSVKIFEIKGCLQNGVVGFEYDHLRLKKKNNISPYFCQQAMSRIVKAGTHSFHSFYQTPEAYILEKKVES